MSTVEMDSEHDGERVLITHRAQIGLEVMTLTTELGERIVADGAPFAGQSLRTR